ncbi:MAG: lysophospholipid acyltransferase family protein [Chloroflexota bacterium]
MSELGYRFVRGMAQLVVKSCLCLSVTGAENIPPAGAYVGISNHLGRLDPLLVFSFLDRRDVVMLVAEKYRQTPGMPWLVRQLDGIFVDRYNSDFATVREALGRLKKGSVLAIAPEGTRSKTESLLPGQPGAAFLAARGGVPILPVGITGTEDRKVAGNLKRLRRTPVHLNIGQPFHLAPLPPGDREAALAAYTDEIMCRIAALLPAAYHGVYAGHPRLARLLAEQAQPAAAA